MTAKPHEEARLDRLLAMAEGGEDVFGLFEAIIASLPKKSEIRRLLGEALDAGRVAVSNGDSGPSVGAFAVLAESVMHTGPRDLAFLTCGVGAAFRSQLEAVDPSDDSNLRNVTGLLAFTSGQLGTAQRLFKESLELAEAAHDDQMAAAATLNLCNVARMRGAADRADELATRALSLYERAGDTRGEAQLRLTMISLALEAGDLDLAAVRLVDAHEITGFRQPDLTASFHHANGRLFAARSEWDEAERAMQASLRAARRSRHSDHELAALQSLAALAADAGNAGLARRRIRAAVTIARERNLTGRLAGLLPSYVAAESRAGNGDEALRSAQELLTITSETGEDPSVALSLLGATLLQTGSVEKGLQRLEEAREAIRQVTEATLEIAETKSTVFHNTVVAHRDLGTLVDHIADLVAFAHELSAEDQPKALLTLAMAAESAHLWPEVEDLLLESVVRRPRPEQAWSALVAAAQLGLQDSAGARIAVLRHALDLAQEDAQSTMAMKIRNDLALALIDDDKLDAALDLLLENAHQAREINDQVTLEQALHNSAETRRRMGNLEGAESDARSSVEIAQLLGDDELVGSALLELGLVLSEQGSLDDARDCYLKALDLVDPDGAAYASCLSGLAGLELAHERADSAIALYERALRVGKRSDLQTFESLIYLGEALALADRRRPFTRRLQQVVDMASEIPFLLHHATGLTRSARRWSQHGKPKFSGEVLAIGVMIWSLKSRDSDGELSCAAESPLIIGMSAAAFELSRQRAEREDEPGTRSAMRAELERAFKSRKSARVAMDLVVSAEEAFQDEEDGL